MKKITIIPRTNPMMFAPVSVSALENMSKSHNAMPIPATVPGGTKAAAIATPTRIPGMFVVIAIPPANPNAIATAKNTGEISVRDKISFVNDKSVN